MLLQIECVNGYQLSVCSNFLEHIYMYFRSSSQTKSPVGSSSGDRNGEGGRQNVGGPNKDNQTVSLKQPNTHAPNTKCTRSIARKEKQFNSNKVETKINYEKAESKKIRSEADC